MKAAAIPAEATSPASVATAAKVPLTVMEHVTATRHETDFSAVVFAIVIGLLTVAACAGMIDSRPKPNADTATSAMRLIDVFVDICFLSLKVELEDFSNSAWLRRTHSSDMSVPFLSLKALGALGDTQG